MKNMVLAIIGMTAIAITVNAQTPTSPNNGGSGGASSSAAVSEHLPIGSVAELQAYAWEHVANISEYGWASSSINATTNNKTSVWLAYSPTNGLVDVEEIFGIIESQQLLLSVLNASDTVSLGAGLYDKNNNNLFYSQWASAPINPPSKGGVSSNSLDLMLEMSDRIFVESGDALWFRIVERDEKGNPIRYYYPDQYGVQNGGIFIPAYFAGKLGEVIITKQDGTETAFSLSSGNKMRTMDVALSSGKVSALGTRTFRNNTEVYVEISGEELLRNINPLSQLVVEKRGWYYFAAWLVGPNKGDSVQEYASSVKIWSQGQQSTTAKTYVIANPPHYVPVFLEPGRYWVEYSFGSGFGKTKNQFYPPYDGGGKG